MRKFNIESLSKATLENRDDLVNFYWNDVCDSIEKRAKHGYGDYLIEIPDVYILRQIAERLAENGMNVVPLANPAGYTKLAVDWIEEN